MLPNCYNPGYREHQDPVGNHQIPDGRETQLPIASLPGEAILIMSNSQNQQMVPSNQATFLINQGMVQGTYTQGPVLMTPVPGYQSHPAGYYFNSHPITNQFVRYNASNYHQSYNTVPMNPYQQEYSVGAYPNSSVIPMHMMAIGIDQNNGSFGQFPIQAQFYERPTQENIVVNQSSDSNNDNNLVVVTQQYQVNQGFVYDREGSFPPEFVPRCTGNNEQSIEFPSTSEPSTNLPLQIQAIETNETDLLPAGLLSPSIESLTSDTDKSQCKETLTSEPSAMELPSLVLDQSTKPPSPVMNLPGCRIFEPQIKYKMFGPRERQFEIDNNAPGSNLKPTGSGWEITQQGHTKAAHYSNTEEAPRSTLQMDMAVEVSGSSQLPEPTNHLSSAAHPLGARPKVFNKKAPKDSKYAYDEQEEPSSSGAQRYRGGNSRSSSRRSQHSSYDRNDNYSSKQSGKGSHAKEKSAGRQKLLAQTAVLFNPHQIQNFNDGVVEGQDVKAKVRNTEFSPHEPPSENESGNQTQSQFRNYLPSEARKQSADQQQKQPRRGVGRNSSNQWSLESTANDSNSTQNKSGSFSNGGWRNNRGMGRRFGNRQEASTAETDPTHNVSGQQRRHTRSMGDTYTPSTRATRSNDISQSSGNGSLSRRGPSSQGKKTYKKASAQEGTSAMQEGTASTSKDSFSTSSQHGIEAKENDELKKKYNQRELLESQLRKGQYECMVCMEIVYDQEPIWSCDLCFHIFHQMCIKQWHKSVADDLVKYRGWRCPSCQAVKMDPPNEYYCFCGKVKYPQRSCYSTPHTCGNTCGRLHNKALGCDHCCSIQCHPGPCPPCNSHSERQCKCGKIKILTSCASPTIPKCNNVCGKDLKCQHHKCLRYCHSDDCGDCEQTVMQACYCKKKEQEVPCTFNATLESISCGDICGKPLNCGNHNCKDICHVGDCKPCELLPDSWLTCTCGQTPIEEILATPRVSCTDAVPPCQKICSRPIGCGTEADHKCIFLCHTGPCSSCIMNTQVTCMCGNSKKFVPCDERHLPYKCTKKCNRKHTCHRHRCLNLCCAADFHPCPYECKRTLNCGVHKCYRLCHVGNCPPCTVVSFDELRCTCGHNVIYPPVPCGTKPPECRQLCNRVQDCDHIPMHACHSYDQCPPCCTFTEKWCFGNHEVRKNVPCHQTEISCGMACGRLLPCGRHSCIQICHKSECMKEGEHCKQKCTTPRTLCGHPCEAICHDGPCPDTPCMQMVKVVCPCKNIVMTRTCCTNTLEYKRMTTSVLASTMADLQQGHSVNIGENIGVCKVSGEMIILECNAECKIKERNKKMAIALQIQNPDLHQKLAPKFNENMRRWAKKDPKFAQKVHDSLTELVTLAKRSKQKSRSHSFPVMNREKRQFVHEYCEHFGCESRSYDEEPKRNVVATASKDSAWFPAMSLIEVIERESGMRKVPVPSTRSKSPLHLKKPVQAVTLTDTKRKASSTLNDASYIKVVATPPSNIQGTSTSNLSYIQVAGKPATSKPVPPKSKD